MTVLLQKLLVQRSLTFAGTFIFCYLFIRIRFTLHVQNLLVRHWKCQWVLDGYVGVNFHR